MPCAFIINPRHADERIIGLQKPLGFFFRFLGAAFVANIDKTQTSRRNGIRILSTGGQSQEGKKHKKAQSAFRAGCAWRLAGF